MQQQNLRLRCSWCSSNLDEGAGFTPGRVAWEDLGTFSAARRVPARGA